MGDARPNSRRREPTWTLREHGHTTSSVNLMVGEINDSWVSAVAVSTALTDNAVTLTAAEATKAFEVTMDAVEEAVVDALLAAGTLRSGNGNFADPLPVETLTGGPSREHRP